MTEYLSAEALSEDDGHIDTVDVELPSGGVVQIRGLSRLEHLRLAKGDPDGDEVERRVIGKGMINPALTDRQLKAWQARPGRSRDLAAVSTAIRDLSGFGEGADKSAVREVGREAG